MLNESRKRRTVHECAVEARQLPGVHEEWRPVEQPEQELVVVAGDAHEVACRGNVSNAREPRIVAIRPRRCDGDAACMDEY